MADGEYRRGIICHISREDLISFCGSDIPFVEGIISVADGDSIFLEETGKRFALALRTDLQYLTPGRDFILNACACKETDIKNRQPDGNLKVFLLEDVLNNHEISAGGTVWVKKANPLPLDRILVGISTEERFLWAKKSLATFLHDCILTGPVTVRENNVYRLSNDQYERLAGNKEEQRSHLTILQCEPLPQGCITSGTSLVVAKLRESDNSVGFPSSGASTAVFSSDPSEIFLVSDFAYNLAGSLPQERLHDSSNACPVGRKCQLKVCVFDLDKRNDTDLTCDASSRLHVSLATLIELRLFNGSWVKVCTDHADIVCDSKAENSSSEEASSQCSHERNCSINECRVVQIVVTASKTEHNDFVTSDDISIPLTTDNEIEDGVAYITPLLYFNLFHKNTLTGDSATPSIYIHTLSDKTQIEADSSTISKSCKPPFATEAHISLVHSHYKAGDSFDLALASHFRVLRVLTVGDIFYVHHNWQKNSDARKEPSSGDDQGKRNLVVYFQVMRLVCENGEAKSCFVDMEHSSLYQVSAFLFFVQIHCTTHYRNQCSNLQLNIS